MNVHPIIVPKAQFDALMEDDDDDPPEHLRALVLAQRQGMGHRAMKSGAEYDVHTVWRKLLKMKRGETAKAKRMTNRRERHEAKAALR